MATVSIAQPSARRALNEDTAMTNDRLTTHAPPKFTLSHPSKDDTHRLTRYQRWIAANGHSWVNPDLAAYRDDLLSALAPRSAQAHLSTVRKALQRVARDRDYLYAVAASYAPPGASKRDLQAMVDEAVHRIDNATHPDESRVSVTIIQDESDSEHIRLTAKQANDLIQQPDRDTLAGLRDAALIGLALATGLRAAELVVLRLDDLYHKFGGQDAILVKQGKGDKQRLVPYGAHITVLPLVHKWLNTAAIRAGAIFRGVTKGGVVLDSAITVRTFERRLGHYLVDKVTLAPHDLRRTYAKQQYTNGMDIIAIRDNLGHASIETTQGYIGQLDAEQRVPVQGYQYL